MEAKTNPNILSLVLRRQTKVRKINEILSAINPDKSAISGLISEILMIDSQIMIISNPQETAA
ncbi:hypothetical protein A3207_00645 [Candidatus Methanomassiliicoccus intestinalis]|uniref:Uncharacterized protein n=2 Tax=Candidatus Methanomassiliicoccus intestinalis TaxID=1406512 RepID=R9T6U5_METII|nr:hypothetical protein [Candidatus Methanomassiliicoccus intestinalis]AGN26344.1 hypothetical protein MMINT_09960 [Candidatus Methanomassiliicoccus intestinalis Issoire-Mx1]TQS84584.1 MAG: hypothetical protein A3207_00645 [Candidatus Methanomassiliicoccus intestinalis]